MGRKFWILTIIAGIAVLVVWRVSVRSEWHRELEALFSGLALVAIVATFIYQAWGAKANHQELLNHQKLAAKAALLQGYSANLKYHLDMEEKHTNDVSQFLREDHAGHARHAAARMVDLLNDIEATYLK